MSIKLIVGLRNPGKAYARTRHNAGGWFVTALAECYNVLFKMDKKLHGELANLDISNEPLKALLPIDFMNHSGVAVRAACQFYRIEPHELLVAHDDLDLPVGRIKLKTSGGHGGHNGLRDIITQLGSTEFHRLRVGIGHPGHKDLVLDYVLGTPSQHDRQLIDDAVHRGIQVIPIVVSDSISVAMSLLNG